ncbi:MAG: phosphate ABC transporter substrate-binding protein, partial [candidate division WOR-3 bacterium]
GRQGITVAGSTSVQPFAERLAEVYMHAHPDIEINVQGGGSSAGIRAVQNHICHIGMSSRHLNGPETTLTAITVAFDAIVLIVNGRNPVSGLTLEQARQVFAGEVRNWRELGGPDLPITVVTREEGSGTRASFEEKVMTVKRPDAEPAVRHFAPDALVQDSNGAVREIVATDPAAIGYISFGLVDDRVKALTLDNVLPTPQTVRSGRYPVGRRFLFLTAGEVDSTTRHFIDFVLSEQGQHALADEGLIRVN